MNCYFTCQKLSKFSKTCFTATKETALAQFNLAHPVGYSTSYNGVPLKCGLWVTQGHWKWHHSVGNYDFLWYCHLSRYMTLKNIVTLKSTSGVTHPANLCTWLTSAFRGYLFAAYSTDLFSFTSTQQARDKAMSLNVIQSHRNY